MPPSDVKDYAHLHFLTLIWGFTAILGLLITIPPVEIVFFRTLIAMGGLAVVVVFLRQKLMLPAGDVFKILGVGFLIAAHWILFFASARVSTASICLAGLATTSFWTSILEPLAMGRKIRWYEISLGLVVIFGLYIIFRVEFNHALGLLMAVISALVAALFTVINAKFTRRYNHYVITFYEMGGAWLGTLVFLPFYSIWFTSGAIQLSPTASDWIYLGILALICTVYAYSASVELMKRISAFAINLTVNLEPVYGIILAALFFGEKETMHPGFYLGAAIILAAALSYPFINRRYGKKALEPDMLR